MNKLQKLLQRKKSNLLNMYCTAGYPGLHDLPTIIQALHEAGVDMVEIGIPYSDPLADGPTIQMSNSIALKNGISIELIFEQLAQCNAEIPKIIMGYFNPVLQYGVERFCARCKETGVDGLILPDLPIDIWETSYRDVMETNGISQIFLVTPQTPDDRIRRIDQLSTSFIYAVTSSGTTGKTGGVAGAETYLRHLAELELRHPVLAGFSISTAADLRFVQTYANGGIIGSAFIKYLATANDPALATKQFISSLTESN
jgi:tryptophan synthase alpha chain